MNFYNRIFSIKDENEFNKIALETFRYQAENCAPYAKYIELLEIDYRAINSIYEIPYLPVEFFKNHKILSSTKQEEIIFTSSGTTGSIQSRHYVADIKLYEESYLRGFELFYGAASECNIYALLPSYLERDGSSLIYMVEGLIRESHDGGFYLYNYEELIERLERRDKSRKTILIGVTFALLDLVERYTLDLSENLHILETGGMKGRRREIPRPELHKILNEGFNTKGIGSEYGMCEALSQSYSYGEGLFTPVPWMKIIARDGNDPSEIQPYGKRGVLNIIDLANRYSCSFLATKDIGICYEDGSFTVEGRVDSSDIRGCNLLI